MDAIEKEINTKVRKIIKNRFEEINENQLNLEVLMREIKSGSEAIRTFMDDYHKTKKTVKDENSEYSWDDSQDLFKESENSIRRLNDIHERLELLNQLNDLIEKELTQVIGNAKFYKESRESIIKMFKVFKE